MKIGDCINVWWNAHADGRTYTWTDGIEPESRKFCDNVAKSLVDCDGSYGIRRLGVWRIKEIKA